jgi:xanthine dehydrogenase molybdopterin-binding subunit B
MAKRRKKPNSIVIEGTRYDFCLLAVIGFDDQGRIKQLQRVREEEIVKLSEDPKENVFVTAYIPRGSLNRDYRKLVPPNG